jgi:secretion/DNA translocation related CpaE-like protein
MTGLARPLFITTDTELLDDLLGAASAVGVAVDVAAEPAACPTQWRDAPLVVLGADAVPAMVTARFPRRADVLLASRGSPGDALRTAVHALGVDQAVGLPDDERILLDKLADVTEPTRWARVLGVVAGRGGAGASTLAAALALTSADRGHGPVWLVDLDPLGGGLDAGLGVERAEGARWPDLGMVRGRLSPMAVRRRLPEVSGVAVLATDPLSTDDLEPDAVRAVLAAAHRGGGTVVLDLPRHSAAGRDDALALIDDLLVVVPTDMRAVLAAGRLVTDLASPPPRTWVVVRPVPHGVTPREVGDALRLPIAGVLDDDPAIRKAAARGKARELMAVPALAELCSDVLDGRPGAQA